MMTTDDDEKIQELPEGRIYRLDLGFVPIRFDRDTFAPLLALLEDTISAWIEIAISVQVHDPESADWEIKEIVFRKEARALGDGPLRAAWAADIRVAYSEKIHDALRGLCAFAVL